ncbi:MAG: archease [Gemmatimonadota bacterium]|nr:archease [Gemmatimonadota bacterium]
MNAKKYELFEHTADLGLHVYGATPGKLFANAAEALMSLLTEPEKIRSVEETVISLEAETAGELLRAWMAELLYLYNTQGILVAGVRFTSLTENRLEAVVLGERVDQSRHEITGEVKAVTWHRLGIEKHEGNLRATLVLDV